jgi:serine/threonine protein kinase/formylglycine-generating enzyme required for sulfatase activity
VPETVNRGILGETNRRPCVTESHDTESHDTESHDNDESLDDSSLADGAPDRAVDGDSAAAGDAAKQEDPAPAPSIIQRIGEITGARPSVSLREVDPAGQTPMLKPLVAGDGVSRETGKYMVHGILGQGGVGTVHRGHDTDLGRDVAMKFLHEKFKDQPAILHRFVEEAQIGGQLQHPGIVPVYELGMSDGRPFFTMKMVKGQTLAQSLSDRKSPAEDRRRFLMIFEQICQTMAYAHTRGVVHRDLKPANIMIGSFGEVQVVDWGMGKVLERGGIADEKRAVTLQSQLSVIETVRSGGHGSQSIMGSVMGTPAYMPPEQARGDVDAMDARSDVFALGAILCEILTGQPPYAGEPQELINMAAMAKLDDAHARLAASSAETDLIELTTECLMPAPAARPQSAESVATAVHEHLAAAEQRVHAATIRTLALKRTQKLGIALTAVIAAGLLASLWFWQGARESAASEKLARGAAEQAARGEKRARGLADQRAAEASAARDAAQTNLANFNRLSHVVRLETAKAEEASLYPAWPDQAEAMRGWLEGDAEELRKALPELRGTLRSIEAEALPRSDAERADARRSHARAGELSSLETKLAVLKSASDVRSGNAKIEPFTLDASKLAKSARELNELAWPLIDPAREVFGREAEGLALARRAVSIAPETGDDRGMVMDTLAWALFSNGLDPEALKQSRAAVAAMSKGKRADYEGYVKKLQAAIAVATGDDGRSALEELTSTVTRLRNDIEQRHTWKFTDAADQFLHGTLKNLVADIETFEAKEVEAVRHRLDWAERVEELTITRHEKRWNEARLAILKANGITASKLYGSSPIELEPQMGLIPIGMNPQSKLWEFYHLRSAWAGETQSDPASIEIPAYDETGKLDMDGRGMVFVLIPGGRFSMGAQSHDENALNFNPAALAGEGPVHEVELSPYMLSKFELTQGQWARLRGGEYPSWYKLGSKFNGIPVPIGDAHPVEHVDWNMCARLLGHHGLILPTEAQWENGCRAGTSTPWSTGDQAGSLEGFANILDHTGQNVPPKWVGGELFDDRFKGPSPVGTYDPNPFGLHDVHGNVWEWCRDWYGGYTLSTRSGDGLRDAPASSGYRISRGGSYRNPARSAGAANRNHGAAAIRSSSLGVRPAKEITP